MAKGYSFPDEKAYKITFITGLAVLMVCALVPLIYGVFGTMELIFYSVCAAVFVLVFFLGRDEARHKTCLYISMVMLLYVEAPLQVIIGAQQYISLAVFLIGCALCALMIKPKKAAVMIGAAILEAVLVSLAINITKANLVFISLLVAFSLILSFVLIAIRTGFVLALEDVSIDNEYLEMNNEELINVNRKDKLTGLYNRAYYDAEIRKAVGCGSKGTPVALLLIDIDLFKEVNDTYGHDVGDLTLKEITRHIKENVRETDIACRYGGEEFAVIMYCDLEVAARRAEQIRKVIEATEIETVGKKTVSIGVAPFKKGMDADAFLKAADDMLYDAKKGGRNQVRVLRGRTYGHLTVVE